MSLDNDDVDEIEACDASNEHEAIQTDDYQS